MGGTLCILYTQEQWIYVVGGDSENGNFSLFYKKKVILKCPKTPLGSFITYVGIYILDYKFLGLDSWFKKNPNLDTSVKD